MQLYTGYDTDGQFIKRKSLTCDTDNPIGALCSSLLSPLRPDQNPQKRTSPPLLSSLFLTPSMYLWPRPNDLEINPYIQELTKPGPTQLLRSDKRWVWTQYLCRLKNKSY